eukprot:682892-Rhodomonas_salina.2
MMHALSHPSLRFKDSDAGRLRALHFEKLRCALRLFGSNHIAIARSADKPLSVTGSCLPETSCLETPILLVPDGTISRSV